MATISHIVRKIIERKPFIEESLSRGIINYGALAEMIQQEVEEELRKKIKTSAVMMALRRYSETARKKLFRQVKFDQGTDLILRSNLVEITIYKSFNSGKIIKNLYDCVDIKKGEFISIIVGVNEISMITNEKNEKSFLKCIGNEDIKSTIKNLSSLTVNIPKESVDMVGLFYLITRALSWENISIIEIVSTFSETSYIIRTKDAPYAFETVKKVVDENRQGL